MTSNNPFLGYTTKTKTQYMTDVLAKIIKFIIENKLFSFSTLFTLLNIADILLTQHALANGLLEGNPILSGNINMLIPIKILGVFVILALAVWCEKKYQTKNAIIAPIMLMGFVVVWNIIQIIKSGVL